MDTRAVILSCWIIAIVHGLEVTVNSLSQQIHIQKDDDNPAVPAKGQESSNFQSPVNLPTDNQPAAPGINQDSQDETRLSSISSTQTQDFGRGVSSEAANDHSSEQDELYQSRIARRRFQHIPEELRERQIPVHRRPPRFQTSPNPDGDQRFRWPAMYGILAKSDHNRPRKLHDYPIPPSDYPTQYGNPTSNEVTDLQGEELQPKTFAVEVTPEDLESLVEKVRQVEILKDSRTSRIKLYQKEGGPRQEETDIGVPFYHKVMKKYKSPCGVFGMFQPCRKWRERRRRKPNGESESKRTRRSIFYQQQQHGRPEDPGQYTAENYVDPEYPHHITGNEKYPTDGYDPSHVSPTESSDQYREEYDDPPPAPILKHLQASAKHMPLYTPWKTIVNNPDEKIWIGQAPDGNHKWWIKMKPLEVKSTRQSPHTLEEDTIPDGFYESDESANPAFKSLPATQSYRQEPTWRKGSQAEEEPSWRSGQQFEESTREEWQPRPQASFYEPPPPHSPQMSETSSWTPTHNFVNSPQYMENQPSDSRKSSYLPLIGSEQRRYPLKDFDKGYFDQQDRFVQEDNAREGPKESNYRNELTKPDDQYNINDNEYSGYVIEPLASSSRPYQSDYAPTQVHPTQAYTPAPHNLAFNRQPYMSNANNVHYPRSMNHVDQYKDEPHSHHPSYVHPPDPYNLPSANQPRSRHVRSLGPDEKSPHVDDETGHLPDSNTTDLKQSNEPKENQLEKPDDDLVKLDDYVYATPVPLTDAVNPIFQVQPAARSFSGYVTAAAAPSVPLQATSYAAVQPEVRSFADYVNEATAPSVSQPATYAGIQLPARSFSGYVTAAAAPSVDQQATSYPAFPEDNIVSNYPNYDYIEEPAGYAIGEDAKSGYAVKSGGYGGTSTSGGSGYKGYGGSSGAYGGQSGGYGGSTVGYGKGYGTSSVSQGKAYGSSSGGYGTSGASQGKAYGSSSGAYGKAYGSSNGGYGKAYGSSGASHGKAYGSSSVGHGKAASSRGYGKSLHGGGFGGGGFGGGGFGGGGFGGGGFGGGGYGHDSHKGHGGGYGHDSHGGGHGGGYGHGGGHGGGYGHDHGHGGGYGHKDHGYKHEHGKSGKFDKGIHSKGYGQYGTKGDSGAYHQGNVKGKWHAKKHDNYQSKGSKVKSYSYGGKGWYKEESHDDNQGYGNEHGHKHHHHHGDHKEKNQASQKPHHEYHTKIHGYHKEQGYH